MLVLEKERERESTTKTIQSTALALESVDDVHGSDGLPPSVLGVGDGVSDYVLEEYLEHSPRLLVDQTTYPLHSASPRQPPDRRLRDPLDVVS